METITICGQYLTTTLTVDRVETDQDYRVDIYLTADIDGTAYRLDGILWRGAEFDWSFAEEPDNYEVEDTMEEVGEFLYSSEGLEFLRSAVRKAGYTFKADGSVYSPAELTMKLAFGNDPSNWPFNQSRQQSNKGGEHK